MNKKQPPFEKQPPLFDPEEYNPVPAWELYDDPPGPAQKESDSNKKSEAAKKNRGTSDLDKLLKKVFNFDSFRPYQRKVCESVVNGKNLLLVMPTGSGKSLCYQLPGIVRGGTTLVVSPLIALMEDQVAGLKEHGLAAERIHSGRTRLQSRAVSRSYLDGELDFLFIAPERLSVPGFSEMLAKRKPVLIAIDEAHCISQWGHDFRPDYRLLGERLPILQPAPVIAMTATATPRVQDDIVMQLGIDNAEMHIHGFRRTNIAIEIIEMLPSDRTGKVREILADKDALPAIIYSPTRQKTEDLADSLRDTIKVEPYHAGIDPETRDKVQASFLSGELDAIVATIAFGMGIDKPDVRTIIHTAMPGTLEGYYQEIGRAGRDGKSSKAILLQSYGDRRVHLFFHEKSYPEEIVLNRVFKKLTKEKTPLEKLRKDLDMEEEEFDNAIEKLWIHGGASVTAGDMAEKGHSRWHVSYRRQKEHRLAQIDEMGRFAKSFSCRMLYLVKHFGDREDKGNPCGICDYCAPAQTMSGRTKDPDRLEQTFLSDILSHLKSAGSLGTGRLYTSVCPGENYPRDAFEELLKSLAREGLITLREDSFDKDGRIIHYQRAELTHEGYSFDKRDIVTIQVPLKDTPKKKNPAAYKKRKASDPVKPTSYASENQELYKKLRSWRNSLAKKRGIPAFRIFSNKVLSNLCTDLPTTEDELYMVNGVGPYFIEKYGNKITEIIKEFINERK